MKNTDRILQVLDAIAKDKKTPGVTTLEIVNALQMDRTLVSRYLNQLIEEGVLSKHDTRPVLYYRKEQFPSLSKKRHAKEIINEFIGATGSLENQVKQCISSVRYPGTGLPLLLTGNSGVGKSYLASLIYEYALEEQIVSSAAKFIIFNCADYANNAELLASKLFGYKKGAFTGAVEDYEGVIAQADGGYLFLDEVHRLSAEGQEKLFLLLDKGVYQPFGDKHYYPVKVRLICATTEDPKKSMIRTFLRRIPIQVHLPDLKKRLVSERLEFIKRFYLKEGEKFHASIKVSKEALNYLMSCSLEGNIGELVNLVKVSCANAFDINDPQEMMIRIKDIPVKSNQNIHIGTYFKEEYLRIDMESKEKVALWNCGYLMEINDIFHDLYEFLDGEGYANCTDEDLLNKITEYYKRITDIAYLENIISSNKFYDDLLYIYIREGLQMLHDCYGVRSLVQTDKNLANMFHILKADIFRTEENIQLLEAILDTLKEKRYKSMILVDRFFEYLKTSISYDFSTAERLFFTLRMITQCSSKRENDINVIILAHGDSTARSIASVVNVLYADYIVEAFDMPIDMQPLDIVEDIKRYAEKLDKRHSAIFLVDMGSLFEIYSFIKDYFKGDVAVINNITTQLAISVGSAIHQKRNMVEIIEQIVDESELQYKYFEKSARRKVIVTTCASGIGTASRMKSIIKNCMVEKEDMIDIITCDYFSLKKAGKQHDIFKKYDVLLIVTTLGLHVPEVPTMLFSEMLTEENHRLLHLVLSEVYDDPSISKIIDNLLKSMTLENILSKMMMLNPERVVDKVSAILSEMEKTFGYEFRGNQKLSLYIHIAVMLERCFFHKEEETDAYQVEHDKKQLDELREIFDNDMTDFNIEIPDWELDMIFRMIDEYREVSGVSEAYDDE